MKIIRSSKCTLQFATESKLQDLQIALPEYGRVANCFIDHFWINPTSKYELLKQIIDIPETWLSSRLRKVAAREAIDMVNSVKEVFDWNKQQVQNRIDLLEKKISGFLPLGWLGKDDRRKQS
jgi:hypothetical protein